MRLNVFVPFCFLCGLLGNSTISPKDARIALPQAGVGQSTSGPKSIETVYTNIQVLKGAPSTELLPLMHFMRASLGVRCEFCHIAEDGKYALDDKPEKKRAREMILMTRSLNEANFGGRNVVTCNSCHQGKTTPVAVPQITPTPLNTTRRIPGEPEPVHLPNVADVLASYEAATHINELPLVHISLEGCHAKLVDIGTSSARAIPRAACNTVDVLFDGTRAVTTSPLADGRTVRVGSNGHRGWTVGPDGLNWIPDPDFIQFQRKVNPVSVARVRLDEFLTSSVLGIEKINGRETYVINSVGADGIAQTLWFAVGDGLLVRRTFYHPIPLGPNPEQFDFSGYKTFGRFALPTEINTSYLDDQHLGILKKLVDVQVGVSAAGQTFDPPDHWPPK